MTSNSNDFDLILSNDEIIIFKFKNNTTANYAGKVADECFKLLITNKCLHGDPPFYKKWFEAFETTKKYKIMKSVYKEYDNIILLELMTIYFPLDVFRSVYFHFQQQNAKERVGKL